MKPTACPSIGRLQREYDRLRQSLSGIGYISQGSVLQRTVASSGRSGYQWTRKQAGKTISVSLSQDQYEAMKQAVANERAEILRVWNSTLNDPGQEKFLRWLAVRIQPESNAP